VRRQGAKRTQRATSSGYVKTDPGWIGERRDSDSPLFPSIRGERLSRDALEHLVRKHCLMDPKTPPSPASSKGQGISTMPAAISGI